MPNPASDEHFGSCRSSSQLPIAGPPFVEPTDLSGFRHFESSVPPPLLFVFGFGSQFKTQEEKTEEGKKDKKREQNDVVSLALQDPLQENTAEDPDSLKTCDAQMRHFKERI